MSTKKIIVIIASTHFLLLLALLAVLKATGFTLITLFGSPPPPTRFQSLVFDLFGVLLYPMCLVEMPKSVPENWFTIGLWAFVFNSIIWGVCLGIVIHAVRQKFRKAPTDLSRPGGVALTGLLVLFSIFAVGCCASLERMAHREIEKRPVSKVYLSGMKYFQDLMKQGQVPGVKSPDNFVWQPSGDLMAEGEMMEVKYPFRMTVKLKEKGNENVLYSYTLLKQSPTVEWRIVEAWLEQIAIQNKADLLQKGADATQ
ncbi:MAG: hypothetical protein DME24_11595 [Verrucomicrobia bacterium]|nr:MAG: hypothetical protein DME24_11595 [Verrucomicrobiota bacterium]